MQSETGIRRKFRVLLGCALAVLATFILRPSLMQVSVFGTKLSALDREAENGTLPPSKSVELDRVLDGDYVQFLPAIKTERILDCFSQPTAPYYATFYYPWYKTASIDGRWSYWQDHGNDPPNTWFSHYLPDPKPENFDPATELYSSNNIETLYWQLAKMAEARLEVAVSSWWGPGDKTDITFRYMMEDIMARQDNPYPNLRWSVYYEAEAYSDPTPSQIVGDLNYLAEHYTNKRAFLKIDDRPVIFVYASGDDDMKMVQRWIEANSIAHMQFYLVLKVFPGFRTVTPQPDSWHQYGPASRLSNLSPYAYSVSPGFWLDEEQTPPRLSRNIDEFRDAVEKMVAADATWKIVLTWNEWGEGTSVEPGEQVRFNADTQRDEPDPGGAPFRNIYIDALKELLPALVTGPDCVGSSGRLSKNGR